MSAFENEFSQHLSEGTRLEMDGEAYAYPEAAYEWAEERDLMIESDPMGTYSALKAILKNGDVSTERRLEAIAAIPTLARQTEFDGLAVELLGIGIDHSDTRDAALRTAQGVIEKLSQTTTAATTI
ncbi:MAG: hypothetical protein Q8Q11_00400 [bacterium]|nr:hypothetical protein [bacterium]MDZ4247818.1 hypothetical protein [Patescibacteria group bacterium]